MKKIYFLLCILLFWIQTASTEEVIKLKPTANYEARSFVLEVTQNPESGEITIRFQMNPIRFDFPLHAYMKTSFMRAHFTGT